MKAAGLCLAIALVVFPLAAAADELHLFCKGVGLAAPGLMNLDIDTTENTVLTARVSTADGHEFEFEEYRDRAIVGTGNPPDLPQSVRQSVVIDPERITFGQATAKTVLDRRTGILDYVGFQLQYECSKRVLRLRMREANVNNDGPGPLRRRNRSHGSRVVVAGAPSPGASRRPLPASGERLTPSQRPRLI